MKALLLVYLFLFSSMAMADSYFIAPVGGFLADKTNKDGSVYSAEEVRQTYTSLIESSLSNQGESVAKEKSKATWVLQPTLVRLGNAYLMSLTKSKNNKVVFTEKLKATTFSDADVVTDRLVRAVRTDEKAPRGQKVDTVTQDETRGTSVKVAVQRQFFFGFGPGATTELAGSGEGFLYTFGYLWGLDHQISLRLGLEGVNVKDSDASAFFIGIGGQYYLNRNKHSPYLLSMLTYGSSQSVTEPVDCTLWCDNTIAESGFGMSLGAGMHFYRTSSVNFAFEAAYNQSFYELVGQNPGSFGLKVKVLW